MSSKEVRDRECYPAEFKPVALDIVFSYPDASLDMHLSLLYEALHTKGLMKSGIEAHHVWKALKAARATY